MQTGRISMRVRVGCGAAAAAMLLGLTGCAPQRTVSLRTLLDEATDLSALTRFPDPAFTCRQFSSYDRRSVAPDQPEPASEGWFANGDANQYLRVEQHAGRSEYVMMDATGPGAIVRIWSANPRGTLRFYLDGARRPAWEVPMAELLGGATELAPEPLAGVHSRGWNCYLPIPYAHHCKVTCDADDFYYHVNYRTYPPGTRVRSFRLRDLQRAAPAVNATARRLAQPRAAGAPRKPNEEPPAPAEITLAPGQSQLVRTWQGPAALAELTVRVAAGTPEQILRRTLLSMSFDGTETVACPLGDFFGAAPGINHYAGLPLGVDLDGTMWSHWRMPFRESATLRLQNLADAPVTLTYSATTSDYTWDDRSLYFHCKWRGEYAAPTRPFVDWTWLAARGRGVFVGAALAIGNPVRGWWGEGDEKIYVDDETFPSTFGTGTEDYFGYAWCSNQPFTHAYHAQPRCDGPGNYGYTANNRWHVLDRIPYQSALRFDMECWHWNERTTVDRTVAVYWYADLTGADDFPPLDADHVRLPALPPHRTAIVEGAIEAETMRLIGMTGPGYYSPHPVELASRDEVGLWHFGRKPGDRLTLGFIVPAAGRYRVLARWLQNVDLATVRVTFNGSPAAEPLNGYAPEVTLSAETDLGIFDLGEGENVLCVEITGSDERAVPRYNWGLDYLRLERADSAPATPAKE